MLCTPNTSPATISQQQKELDEDLFVNQVVEEIRRDAVASIRSIPPSPSPQDPVPTLKLRLLNPQYSQWVASAVSQLSSAPIVSKDSAPENPRNRCHPNHPSLPFSTSIQCSQPNPQCLPFQNSIHSSHPNPQSLPFPKSIPISNAREVAHQKRLSSAPQSQGRGTRRTKSQLASDRSAPTVPQPQIRQTASSIKSIQALPLPLDTNSSWEDRDGALAAAIQTTILSTPTPSQNVLTMVLKILLIYC